MKLGISTYSLHSAYKSGELTLEGVIESIAGLGAQHAEIVPIGYNLVEQPELIELITRTASNTGLELSNYAISANFSGLDEATREQEIARVKSEVDVCAALGIKRMRHDIAKSDDVSIGKFLAEMPVLVDVCRQIADHAATYGITTSIENHGYFVQHSDRVQVIVNTVARDNFRTTLDVGNFLCADEDPVIAVAKNIGLASIVHFKDFYIRPAQLKPGEDWFSSTGGRWLRGAIVGQGDINMPEIVKIVKNSGYDGYISIEFEGIEESKRGTKLGMDYIKRMWEEL